MARDGGRRQIAAATALDRHLRARLGTSELPKIIQGIARAVVNGGVLAEPPSEIPRLLLHCPKTSSDVPEAQPCGTPDPRIGVFGEPPALLLYPAAIDVVQCDGHERRTDRHGVASQERFKCLLT